MCKTFKSMGKMGDIIFSLPTIRELGGGILYIPEDTPDGCKGMYSAMKDLLMQQPYITEVREYPSGLGYKEVAPGIKIDYDLDLARDQPAKGRIHIVKRYMDAFGINYRNWKEPWLKVDDEPQVSLEVELKKLRTSDRNFSLFSYTGRYMTNDRMPSKPFNWKPVIDSIQGKKFFVGTFEEHAGYFNLFGMPWIMTRNILELARVVKQANAIYCNQSLTLALAQALGKTYYVFPRPFKTNCLLYTPNEYILT